MYVPVVLCEKADRFKVCFEQDGKRSCEVGGGVVQ